MKTRLFLALLVLPAWSQAQTFTLDQALATARTSRQALVSVQLDVESAALNARGLGSYPALTLGVGQSDREGLGATDQDLFMSLPVDLFGKVSASKNLGRAQTRIAEAQRRQTLLTIQTEVLIAYFEAVAAARLKHVADGHLQVVEALHQATVRRLEEGTVPELQVTRSSIELARARQAVATRSASALAAWKRVEAATGADLASQTPDLGASLAAPEVDLALHPDIMVLAAQVSQAEAERVHAQREGMPELELVGLRTPWREPESAYGLRLQLTWRGLDFGRSRNEQAAASKRRGALQAALRDATSQAEANLAALDIEIEDAGKRLVALQAIRDSASVLVAKSQQGFTQGYGTLLDVLEATRALREIEQEREEAQLAVNLAVAAKYGAAGRLIEVSE